MGNDKGRFDRHEWFDVTVRDRLHLVALSESHESADLATKHYLNDERSIKGRLTPDDERVIVPLATEVAQKYAQMRLEFMQTHQQIEGAAVAFVAYEENLSLPGKSYPPSQSRQ